VQARLSGDGSLFEVRGMSALGLFDSRRHPITFDNELGVEEGSRDHVRVAGATHGCRWCGRDLDPGDTSCRHGCGHTWAYPLGARA